MDFQIILKRNSLLDQELGDFAAVVTSELDYCAFIVVLGNSTCAVEGLWIIEQ
jgi:hypothetical protein